MQLQWIEKVCEDRIDYDFQELILTQNLLECGQFGLVQFNRQ